MAMGLRSAKYVNKPPEAYVKKPNNNKHGKKHAKETSRSQGKEAHQPRGAAPGQKVSPMEAMVEGDEQQIGGESFLIKLTRFAC
jgi:hypothetical protein